MFNLKMLLKLKSLIFLLYFLNISVSGAAILEEVVKVPVTVKNIYGAEFHQEILVTVFRDDSKNSSPWLVLNHGRPTSDEIPGMSRQRYSSISKYFVEKGFAVFVPTRVGYGPTGGNDVEYSGRCGSNNYPIAFQAASSQVLAVIRYAKTLPFIDLKRGLVVGQSYGGMTSIAISTYAIEGLRGVVNFSGGGGGNPQIRPGDPCGVNLLKDTYISYGQATKVPSLWMYSVNDLYWGESYPKEWFEGFKLRAEKNKIFTKFVSLPAFGHDGHSSFTRNFLVWRPHFEDFIYQLGF
jgi:dienelactone hydrolase